jgi:hypothetical protein
MLRFEFKFGSLSFIFLLSLSLLVWRIVIACLVVCR